MGWNGLQLCLQSPFFCIMKPLMRLLNSSNKGIKSRILPIVSLVPWLLTQSQFTLCSKWSKGPITINLCHSIMGFWLKLVTSVSKVLWRQRIHQHKQWIYHKNPRFGLLIYITSIFFKFLCLLPYHCVHFCYKPPQSHCEIKYKEINYTYCGRWQKWS